MIAGWARLQLLGGCDRTKYRRRVGLEQLREPLEYVREKGLRARGDITESDWSTFVFFFLMTIPPTLASVTWRE